MNALSPIATSTAIVTHTGNKAFFEAMGRRPHTILPDTLARSPKAVASIATGGLKIGANGSAPGESRVVVKSPKLWSLEKPQRYVVVTTVEQGGKAVDVYETPFGIRTHSTKNRDFDAFSYHLGSIWPHDNWMIAQGLKRLGFAKEYHRIESAQVSAAQVLRGRLPELYFVKNGKLIKDSEACIPQGWSSGGLLNFLTAED